MKGSKRERRAGVWELRVYAGQERLTGRKRYVSRTYRGGARAAEDALRDLIREVQAQADQDDGDVTVAELLEQWYSGREAEWSPSTADDHRKTIDAWLVPRIGDWRVTEVRVSDLERFYAELARKGGRRGQGLSPTSVRKAHSVLHAALEDAVRWDLIVANPSSRARRPKLVKHRPTVPSLDQIRAAVAAADPAMAALIRVAIATGVRRGELVGLRWGDIDLEAGTITVQRAVVIIRGQVTVKGTKTGEHGLQHIDPGTVAVLRSWRHARRAQHLEAGFGRLGAGDWVWTAYDLRSPWPPDQVTYRWRTLADRVGLKDVRLHDLRHAAATHMVAAGVDVRTVAGRLRHASPAMTLDVYADRDMGADQAAAATMGRLLDG
jgi:integrase